MWKNESGQAYTLASLIDQLSDIIVPLNGLGGFVDSSPTHSGTIFRLPLRTVASDLSDNVYDIQKLQELLDVLRQEAKYLLLFLKSICKIQVVHIKQDGEHNLSFSIEINPDCLSSFEAKRHSFMQQLREAHENQPYSFRVNSYSARLSVIVVDSNSKRDQSGTTDWLLSTCVGSANHILQVAAKKQHTVPWIGAALQIGRKSVNGRIFCFLPLPLKISGMPIHINGTFRLSDDKQALKLPGIERRNDPSLDWNKILISYLLPSTYSMLLMEAKKRIAPDDFYSAWPNVELLQDSSFSMCLKPLLSFLFKNEVIWAQKPGSRKQVGEWINISQAMFIPKGSNISSALKGVLSNFGFHLVTVPDVVFKALKYAKANTREVSPAVVRHLLRSSPKHYLDTSRSDKSVLLIYCISDNNYRDLHGLKLLPLANGSFTSLKIAEKGFRTQTLYLCTKDCPPSLFPILSHLLVDSVTDLNLHKNLKKIAINQDTNLRVLSLDAVASLLTQAMPSSWQRSSLVDMPNHSDRLTLAWLKELWTWLKSKDLKTFRDQLLVPCFKSASDSPSQFFLTRLSSSQPVIFVSRHAACSQYLLSALYKLNLRVCLQREFTFVQHEDLFEYINSLDVNNVLDAIIASPPDYKRLSLDSNEADSFIAFLNSGSYISSGPRKTVLQKIPLFSPKFALEQANLESKVLYSIEQAATQSITEQALVEPSDKIIRYLPANLVLLSRRNHNQVQLLKTLNIPFPSDVGLLIDHIFPIIKEKSFLSSKAIDSLMSQVLDRFDILNSRESDYNLAESIKALPFIEVDYEFRSPQELFDPKNTDVVAFFRSIKNQSFVKTSDNHVFEEEQFDPTNKSIVSVYKNENMYPQAPYNTLKRIAVLKTCGLQTSINPQILLDIIEAISLSGSSEPKNVASIKLKEAVAMLQYMSSPTFEKGSTPGYYTVASQPLGRTFSSSLRLLATSRSWLPILSNEPPSYPKELFWKGSSFKSHLISLSDSVVILSNSKNDTKAPFLVGSQVYIVSHTASPEIKKMLQIDSSSFTRHVIAHFKEILRCQDKLSVNMLEFLAREVYSYMNNQHHSFLQLIYAIPEWIYIKNEGMFVSPGIVALTQNPNFRRDLRPYIFILPENLSIYTSVFGSASGILPTVCQSQILSVLKNIREDVEANHQRTTSTEAWNMVLNILNWLTNNGNEKISDEVNPEDVLLPTESRSEWPQLVQASETVYTENRFLMSYLNFSANGQGSYAFVHTNVNIKLAQNLGATPLSEILDISEDTFEDAGQNEPLTVRLKNILRDYKDGLTIVKELLQNADDAEATEVNFCYDARQHENDPKRLFFSGMSEAHGPALVVHNNKPFTNEDFENITKLAATSKREDSLKIGQFGVGFCSVYHITDIPSFVSRDKLYIFDPTLSFLRREVKNLAQPGKRIDFTHQLFSGSAQLSPYTGLFGFSHSEYPETIFRFPFRKQASELSGICYTEKNIEQLIKSIAECGTNLLLFLQNVKTITFQRIDQGQSTPVILLRVTKQHVPLPISLPSEVEIQEFHSMISEQSESCHWLVSHCSESKSPNEWHMASAACLLGESSTYAIKDDFEGESFCFLPLCQNTGLPVHTLQL